MEKLPLQPKSERSRPNLDRWGKWKMEAIKGYDRASSEYLHKKSPGEKAVQGLLDDPKALSRLSVYEIRDLKGYLLMHKLGRHGMSLLASMGESTAHLAPDSWKGVAFDIGTLGVGGVTKILKLSKLGRLAMPVAKTQPLQTLRSASRMRKAIKSTETINVAVGRPELTGKMLRIQKANEIVSGAVVAKKTMDAAHTGHMIHKSAPIVYEGVKYLEGEKQRSLYRALKRISDSKVAGHTTQKRTLTPRTPFSQHPLSQIAVSNISKRAELSKRRNPYPKGPRYSFIDPIKIAERSLRYEHKDSRPLIPTDKPFMSTVDRLKAIETRAIEQRRIYRLMDRFETSISKPQSFNAHEQMRQKYGAKIDAIAKGTPKSTPGSARISPQDWAALQKKIGVDSLPKRVAPDINRNRPPQIRIIPRGTHPSPYSSGRSNPLRQLDRTLMNPNRARPMVRAPAFR